MLKHSPITRSALLAALLAAGLVPAAARADDQPVIVKAQPDTIRTELVSYAALDLATAKGRKALQFRVGGAIQRVCRFDLGRDGLQDRGYYACEQSAWGRAAPQIDRAVAEAEQLALGGAPARLSGAITVSAS
jgi:UrcA family protein